MKVLIISGEVWQDGTNGGNVLTNMFSGFDAEFAQIYCKQALPQNKICKKYYQMSDKQAMKAFLKHKPIGKELVFEDFPSNTEEKNEQSNKGKRADKFFHKYNLGIFHFFEDFLWETSNWENDNLKKFIDEFNPDIIFAPCYGSKFLCRLTRFVAEYTKKKVISYYSDDDYTLRHFRLSLYFWIKRFKVRRQLRKTFPYYSLCYTMTERQKEQCEKDFKANMKILLKPVDINTDLIKQEVNNPIKIVYAGGIYLNRWKTLKKLVDAIKEVNKEEQKIVLDIYTGNYISKKINKCLNDGFNSIIHGKVSSKELFEIYRNSDIALHVESFDLKNRLAVRMSFSTKITDCLSSGCAVMAICDSKQGGFEYLKKNDLAICLDSPKKILSSLKNILDNKDIILEYSKKALEFSKEKHNAEKIREDIKKDFINILGNGEENEGNN